MDAAQRLGYNVDYAAKALKLGYSNTVVVLVVMTDIASAHSLATATISRRAAKYKPLDGCSSGRGRRRGPCVPTQSDVAQRLWGPALVGHRIGF